MLLRESLGISADGSERAFPAKDVDSLMERAPPAIVYSARDPLQNTQHVYVAVDPSGGGASAFSIASLVQAPSGFLHVRRFPRTPPPIAPTTPRLPVARAGGG